MQTRRLRAPCFLRGNKVRYGMASPNCGHLDQQIMRTLQLWIDHHQILQRQRVVDDADIAQRWSIEGRGIAYKSELDTENAISANHLVRLFPGWRGEHIPLNAILPSSRFVPARSRALVKHLQENFAAR